MLKIDRSPSWSDTDIDALQGLLDSVPAPYEPLDVSALDGFLAGLVLQRPAVPQSEWMPVVVDVEGRLKDLPDPRLGPLLIKRYLELDAVVERRQWFDPWVFEFDDAQSPSEMVMPWVAGFATAMDRFPAVMRCPPEQTLEPLAQLYAHLDPDDLEDADDLLAVIDTLEPPRDLPEAVESLVRATLLLADVTRPLAPRSPTRTAPARPARPGRPGPGRRR